MPIRHPLPGVRPAASACEDLNVLATLFVNSMIVIAQSAEALEEALEEIRRTAVKQLRMIVIGINGCAAARNRSPG